MRVLFALVAAAMLIASPVAAQDARIYVDFVQNRSDLSAAQRARLDQMVAVLRGAQHTLVIMGHADASEANALALSQQRSTSVHDYFVAQGIAAARITKQAFGAERPVGSAVENPRVEIAIGEPSGW
jgi:outer membrane protein OmpA-like peptidoglycan-associated protein